MTSLITDWFPAKRGGASCTCLVSGSSSEQLPRFWGQAGPHLPLLAPGQGSHKPTASPPNPVMPGFPTSTRPRILPALVFIAWNEIKCKYFSDKHICSCAAVFLDAGESHMMSWVMFSWYERSLEWLQMSSTASEVTLLTFFAFGLVDFKQHRYDLTGKINVRLPSHSSWSFDALMFLDFFFFFFFEKEPLTLFHWYLSFDHRTFSITHFYTLASRTSHQSRDCFWNCVL